MKVEMSFESMQAERLREQLMRPLNTCEWCGTANTRESMKCSVCCRTLAGDPNHKTESDTDKVSDLWEEVKADAVELFHCDPHIYIAEGNDTNNMPRATIEVADMEFEGSGGSLHEALFNAHADMMHEAARQGRGE